MKVVLNVALGLLAISAVALILAKLPCFGVIVIGAIILHLMRRAGL